MTYFSSNVEQSWQKALLWGYFVGHCKEAKKGNWRNRVIHLLIAATQFLPIISQVSSLAEKLLFDSFISGKQLPHGKKIENKTNQSPIPKFNFPISNEVKITDTKTLEVNKSDTSELGNASQAPLKSLLPLNIHEQNFPIILKDLHPMKKVSHFSKNAIFYGYNAEGVNDCGWGCAWRAIQTCLSAYQLHIPFEKLFHLFGPFANLKNIYQNKYPLEELSDESPFAPYDIPSGWAEPFIGQMALHYFGIDSDLEVVNGIPNCHSPDQVFHHSPLDFQAFLDRLRKHFSKKDSAPVMIDDGIYAMNILGIEEAGSHATLWMGDPHIKSGVNQLSSYSHPVGLYKITLNMDGEQIGNSVYDKDIYQQSLFTSGSYNNINFNDKNWMVLFPQSGN